MLESTVAGDSRYDIPLSINSTLSDDLRFNLTKLEENNGQWIPKGIKRPVLITKNVVSHYDGKLVIKFPEDFVIPENWKSMNKEKRDLFEQQAMEIVVSPVGTQTKEDVAFNW